MKFEIEIPKQTRVTLQKPCHLILKPEDPICLPGGHFESGIKFIGFYPYTQVMCYCILDLKFKAKLKLESWNQKKPILIVTLLKINRLLPMAAINMHMKFEIEIPKQTWLTLRKPCHLQMDKVIPVIPPSSFVGRGYNEITCQTLEGHGKVHNWYGSLKVVSDWI